MKYYLPFNPQEISTIDRENSSIDMSDLRFPGNKKNHKRASFLFMRNTDLVIPLDFSGCSYEDKEEFLMLYLFGDIETNAEILATTWLEILLFNQSNSISLSCIFDENEILRFIDAHEDFIKEIYQLSISLPVYSIYIYGSLDKDEDKFEMESFERTDYDRINLSNFAAIAAQDDFLLLLQPSQEDRPKFYTKYFTIKNRDMDKVLAAVPYLGLLNIMLGPEDAHADFIDGINEMLTVGGESDDGPHTFGHDQED